MIWDTFMINGDPAGPELDILECRLSELEDVNDLVHVAIEADVDHQDHGKPFYLSDNLERFAPWKNRLRVVRATGLPTLADDPDPWARETSQREYAREAMTDASPSDVVLHGDLDEIPDPMTVRNVRPGAGMVVFEMVCCSQAVNLIHPDKWPGTMAASVGRVDSFQYLRETRNVTQRKIQRAGFHLGWLGGIEAAWKKVASFCHPEILPRLEEGMRDDGFYWNGVISHVDMEPLTLVDIDDAYSVVGHRRPWPRYVRERNCPDSWFRS
jgi:hypothetical protein